MRRTNCTALRPQITTATGKVSARSASARPVQPKGTAARPPTMKPTKLRCSAGVTTRPSGGRPRSTATSSAASPRCSAKAPVSSAFAKGGENTASSTATSMPPIDIAAKPVRPGKTRRSSITTEARRKTLAA